MDLKQETIKKFEELKERLFENTTENNYCDLINTATNYDNEAQDSLYLYDTIQELVFFVDEEILQQLIKKNAEYGISRLRYFINDTYNADIYKLNVYENLENVSDDDFELCIDECIERLQNA